MSNEVPVQRGGDDAGPGDERSPEVALDLMRRALQILDQEGASPDIGAHLDHAIQRLREELGNTNDEGD